MRKLMLAGALSLAMAAPVAADDMGLSVSETYTMIQEQGENVLFVDVRDPVEIMFVGGTHEVDANIPFLIVDRHDWDDEKNRFRPNRNPNFVEEINAALDAKGLDQDATIITMCRSGSERGEPSARFLAENGFENARYVVNGFQGGSIKDGEQAGFRLKNGWQNSGKPWTTDMDADIIYRTDR